MRSPESFEKTAIKKHLEKIGAWHFSPYMAGMGKTGVPDIICCYRTVFIAIEVKRPGKKPTPIQERRMEEVRKAGGIAIWGTAEKVIDELKRMFPNAAQAAPAIVQPAKP